ncbi:hypothetical protein PG999_003165 [Apiospora kogelbergensis]|uniref:LYC1 C-terminal domain-containing protein n=1 Tax=Apiospora kogelbergensis TaxID=1337665 RepID=A0AAW0RAF3_9PEZI
MDWSRLTRLSVPDRPSHHGGPAFAVQHACCHGIQRAPDGSRIPRSPAIPGRAPADAGRRPLVPVYQATLACPPGRKLHKALGDIPRGRPIADEELSRLCIADVEGVKREFTVLAAGPGDVHVAVLPTPEIIGWLHDRGDFVAQKTLGRVPGHHGAISECGRLWLYWYHDFRKEQLGIQRVRLPPRLDGDGSDNHDVVIRRLAGLLHRALGEAEEWGLPNVVVWEPTAAVVEAMDILARRAGVSLRTEERIGRSIPSLRFRADDTPSSVHFHMKELYMWS